MNNTTSYSVEYLPVARKDLIDIVKYVSETLKNPHAAESLAEEIVRRIESLQEMPYRSPVLIPIKSLKHEYRKLIVKNYLILYWVDEANRIVTVARIIYYRRDYNLE